MFGRPFTKEDIDKNSKTRFNTKSLLGKGCMIQIEHKENEGRVSAKVANPVQVPKGVPVPDQVNDSVYFAIEPGFDQKVFESLSPWCKAKIETSDTWLDLNGSAASSVDDPRMAMTPAKKPLPPECWLNHS
jgi:hypothetical protein